MKRKRKVTPVTRKRVQRPEACLTYKGKGKTNRYDNVACPAMAYKYCLLGATNLQLADFFGVSEEAIANWLRTRPDFRKAVTDGRDKANAEVAHSMYKRAIGYEYKERKYKRSKVIYPVYDDEGNEAVDEKTGIPKTEYKYEMVLQEESFKHVPPDVAAGKFFLWNRTKMKPVSERWASERVEITGKDDEPLIPSETQLSMDERAKATRIAMMMALAGEDKG